MQRAPQVSLQNVLTGVNHEEREKVNDAQWEIKLLVSQIVSQEMDREVWGGREWK